LQLFKKSKLFAAEISSQSEYKSAFKFWKQEINVRLASFPGETFLFNIFNAPTEIQKTNYTPSLHFRHSASNRILERG